MAIGVLFMSILLNSFLSSNDTMVQFNDWIDPRDNSMGKDRNRSLLITLALGSERVASFTALL